MFRSFRRVAELVPAVTAILERRLRHRDKLADLADPEMRARLDRLAAIQGRQRVVAELARDVRFHYFDEPLLAVAVADEYAGVERDLDALREDPDGADRADRIDRLVACAQPLRARCCAGGAAATTPGCAECCWKSTPAGSTGSENCAAFRSASTTAGCSAPPTTTHEGRPIHLVTGYARLEELPELSHDDRPTPGHGRHGREVVVDLALWRHGESSDDDAIVAEAEKLLSDCDFGRLLHRLDLTVTTVDGAAPERFRTHHVTYRQRDGQFVEDPLYRNLHPMLAKRLDLWRLANFELRRLRSRRGRVPVPRRGPRQPRRRRLFALAEIRDLTPCRTPTARSPTRGSNAPACSRWRPCEPLPRYAARPAGGQPAGARRRSAVESARHAWRGSPGALRLWRPSRARKAGAAHPVPAPACATRC